LVLGGNPVSRRVVGTDGKPTAFSFPLAYNTVRQTEAKIVSEFTTPRKPLLGTDEGTIDDKGRVLVSKKNRERLGDDFVLGLGDVGCLVFYTKDAWEKTMERIMSHDDLNSGRHQYARLVAGNSADDLKFDSGNRVVIPPFLRKKGNLKSRIVLVGAIDRLELWDADEYEKYEADPASYGLHAREALERAYTQMTGRIL
jgi:MraZ protein